VNCWDHGRELQIAITNGFGECYNPTECGSQDDAQKTTTLSQLLGVKASGVVLQTTSNPAFWLAPGEKEPNPSPTCSIALNTVLTSSYTTSKQVTIVNNQLVEYLFSIYVADDCSQIQIEGPTMYMGINFNTFYTIDPKSGVVTQVDTSNGEVPLPLMFTTSDGNYAIAAVGYAPSGWALSYAKFYFPNLSGPTDNTSKWSVVYRFNSPIPKGTNLSFKSNLCVGDKNSVPNCVKSIGLQDSSNFTVGPF